MSQGPSARIYRRLTRRAWIHVALLIVGGLAFGGGCIAWLVYVPDRTVPLAFPLLFGSFAVASVWSVAVVLRMRVELYEDGSIVAPRGWLGRTHRGSADGLAGYRIRPDSTGESIYLFDAEGNPRAIIPGYLAGIDHILDWIAARLPDLDGVEAAARAAASRDVATRDELAHVERSMRGLHMLAFAQVILVGVAYVLGVTMAFRAALAAALVAVVWVVRLAHRHSKHVTFAFGAHALSPPLTGASCVLAMGLLPSAWGVEDFVVTSWPRLLCIAAVTGVACCVITWVSLRGTRARRSILLLGLAVGGFGSVFVAEVNTYWDFGRMWREQVPVLSVDPPARGDRGCILHLGPHASAPGVRRAIRWVGPGCHGIAPGDDVTAWVAPGLLQVRWVYGYRVSVEARSTGAEPPGGKQLTAPASGVPR